MSRKVSTNGPSDGIGPHPTRQNGNRHPRPLTSPTGPHEPGASTAFAGNPLLCLVTRDDGWLRIVPGRDTESVYIKWKFSHGPHAGFYVMAVVQYWQMGYGLSLLVDKLDAVDEGSLKPTRDVAYNP